MESEYSGEEHKESEELGNDVANTEAFRHATAASRSAARTRLEAVAKDTESLEKLTDLTICLCCKLSNSSPLMAFQTLAEKSAAPLQSI